MRWAHRTSGLFKLIEDPGRVLTALDTADLHNLREQRWVIGFPSE
jgi:hypothetical protein